MSAGSAAVPTRTVAPQPGSKDFERGHLFRLRAMYGVAIAFLIALSVYGFNYYRLGAEDRPFSEKHHLLRPSGPVGLYLGVFGFFLFCAIFLYPLRKHWAWLGKIGNTRHWLDVHVAMGLAAPFLIAFHASFKFQGFAGVAFWIMAAVAASGVIGRYVYGQIPRSLNTAEVSMRELQDDQGKFAAELAEQRLLRKEDLALVLELPSAERVQRMPMVVALGEMIWFDFLRVIRIARMRRHTVGLAEKILTLGGLRATGHADVERAIASAREQAKLSKRVIFLSRAEQVFHLWHVVHKPFSYTFAFLALIHIGVVISMGYLPWLH
jgi:hypothetical protein